MKTPNSGRNPKILQSLKFTEEVNVSDFFPLKKDISGVDRWARIGDLIETVAAEIEIPTSVEASVPFMIDYTANIQTLAVWFVGNYENRISTEANAVAHSGTQKWHLSRLDVNNANLDEPHGTDSLWDYLIDAAEGATILFKIYNREDKTQYIYLQSNGDSFSKQNASVGSPAYYDLEFEATVIKSNGLVDGNITNPTVAVIVGRQKDVIRNRTDTFSSLEKVFNVVTLTPAEYAALSVKDPETLYITNTSSCSPDWRKTHTFSADTSYTLINNEVVHLTSESEVQVYFPTAIFNAGAQVGIVGNSNYTANSLEEESINGGGATLTITTKANQLVLFEADGVGGWNTIGL